PSSPPISDRPLLALPAAGAVWRQSRLQFDAAQSLREPAPPRSGANVRDLALYARCPRETTMSKPAESRYGKIYARWKADPMAFWGEAARAIDWIEPPATVFDASAGVYG